MAIANTFDSISVKRISGAGNRPADGTLSEAELCVNVTDGSIFTSPDGLVIQRIGLSFKTASAILKALKALQIDLGEKVDLSSFDIVNDLLNNVVSGNSAINNPKFTGSVAVPTAQNAGEAVNLSQVSGLIDALESVVTALSLTVDSKADNSDLSALEVVVSGKPNLATDQEFTAGTETTKAPSVKQVASSIELSRVDEWASNRRYITGEEVIRIGRRYIARTDSIDLAPESNFGVAWNLVLPQAFITKDSVTPWIKIAEVNGLSNSAGDFVCIEVIGGSDFGASSVNSRFSADIMMAERGGVIYTDVCPKTIGLTNPTFHTRSVGANTFELWMQRFTSFSSPVTVIRKSESRNLETRVGILQLSSAQPSGIVTVSGYDLSGNRQIVRTDTIQSISGQKTFTTPVFVPQATNSSHAVNLGQVSNEISLVVSPVIQDVAALEAGVASTNQSVSSLETGAADIEQRVSSLEASSGIVTLFKANSVAEMKKNAAAIPMPFALSSFKQIMITSGFTDAGGAVYTFTSIYTPQDLMLPFAVFIGLHNSFTNSTATLNSRCYLDRARNSDSQLFVIALSSGQASNTGVIAVYGVK